MGFFGRGIGWPDPFNLAKNDLPLPLYTLQWEERKGPTFYQFAQICQAVHDKAPEYSLVAGRHCYWFALGVYTATKLAYGGVEETWPFANMRGSPTFLLPWGSTDSNKLKVSLLFVSLANDQRPAPVVRSDFPENSCQDDGLSR